MNVGNITEDPIVVAAEFLRKPILITFEEKQKTIFF